MAMTYREKRELLACRPGKPLGRPLTLEERETLVRAGLRLVKKIQAGLNRWSRQDQQREALATLPRAALATRPEIATGSALTGLSPARNPLSNPSQKLLNR